ncbi:MAG: hypothetical protein IKZ82_07285 [Clostridia bacterium]|nr:hypothetical protein [Clostridia bacterium]
METETIIIEKNGSGAPLECCVNSVNYRIERGVKVEVPHEVAEVLRRSRAERQKSEKLLAAFSRADGMKL